MSRIDSRRISWDGDVLRVNSRELARIERDSKYPNMWRVRLADGRLSDMVNSTRAKEAAFLLSSALNKNASGAADPSLPSGKRATGLPKGSGAPPTTPSPAEIERPPPEATL